MEPEDIERKFASMVTAELIRTGERDKLVHTLRTKLVECGWTNKVTAYCHQMIYDVGVDNVTMNMLVEQVTPTARELVPNEIKRDMLFTLQTLIESKLKEKINVENDENDENKI